MDSRACFATDKKQPSSQSILSIPSQGFSSFTIKELWNSIKPLFSRFGYPFLLGVEDEWEFPVVRLSDLSCPFDVLYDLAQRYEKIGVFEFENDCFTQPYCITPFNLIKLAEKASLRVTALDALPEIYISLIEKGAGEKIELKKPNIKKYWELGYVENKAWYVKIYAKECFAELLAKTEDVVEIVCGPVVYRNKWGYLWREELWREPTAEEKRRWINLFA